ncbi:heparinase II/III domain-containing protein [Kribbella sp. CA-293567]|uniref:heparinase II/III domain-containing protein n=1 Tax=Kribbella sp. CA-293567 TaxID=3002436 RepID=UPI0022DDC5C9|nr:heparinase II/III family protein [Kribbella sp. CA-293567]WBQ03906.1 heparinase II/III family protein [Kribbella sp. CA-293567]
MRVRATMLAIALIAGLVQPLSQAQAEVSADPPPPAGNLVLNPGFEAGAASPASWTLSSRTTWDTAATGRSLRISSTTGAGWEGATSASFGLDGRRVSQVTVSGRMKLDGVTQGPSVDNQAKLYIAFVNASGTKSWQGIRLQGTQDWTDQPATYAVPAGTVSAFLSLALDRAVGTVWFDDLTVTAKQPVNLVANPGFETVGTDPACPATSWCTPYQSQVYDLDTTEVSSGTRSLRIKGVPGKKVGGFVTTQIDQATWPVITVGADLKADRIVSSDFTDTPGGVRVSLNFSYVDAAGQTVYTGSSIIAGVITGSRDWARIEGTLRLPPKTKRVQVIPTVTNASGTMWLDNVTITPESNWVSPTIVAKSAAAGAQVVHYATITNRREVADTFRLGLDDSALTPFTAEVEPATTALLQPGQSVQAKVTVTVPPGQQVGAVRQVKLTAAPSGAPDLTQLAWLNTTVAAQADRGEQPQVFNTPAELDALRNKIAAQGWAKDAYTKVVKAEADAWLTRPLDQTMFHNAWSGNYKCPGTNTSLQFDFAKPTEHRCPIDGKVYSGEPYDSSWIEIWHNNAAQGAADLGLAYQLTPATDPARAQYAAKARDILRYYADRFLSVPLNGLYGRVHYQVLDEAVVSIGLVDAYDLIHETLTPGERVDLEQNLLRPMADLLISWPTSTSNFQAWSAAGIYSIGAAINDPGYRAYALRDPEAGLEFLLDKARMEDGWWWEGSASYHIYALQALTSLVTAARNLPEGQPDGRDYTNDPRFKQMYTTMLPYLYPDLTIPAAGDGGNWGRRFGVSFAQFAEWAYGQYHDPRFAAALDYAYTNAKLPRTDRWALRYGADSVPPSSGLRVSSKNHQSLGEATMHSGNGRNLTPNPGFEDDDYWKLNGAVPDSDVVFDGERSMKVTGSAQQDVPLDGSRVAGVKLSAMAKGTGKLTAVFLDGAGRAIATRTRPVNGADWAAYHLDAQVPPAARGVELKLEGTAWFDNVDLWTGNLIRDPGFEGKAFGWTKTGSVAIAPLPYRGVRAAGVMGAGLQRNGWSTEIPVIGGNVAKLTLGAKVRAVGLVPLGGGGRLQLDFLAKDGSVKLSRTESFHGTFGWSDRTIATGVPAETVKVRVSLVVEKAAGIAWFDDVTLGFVHAIDPFQANYLRLDYGIPGGTHGHADKLHLDVAGAGGLQSTDLGQVYGASNADLTENWYRETVSHNTVVVDGTSQDRNARGTLKYFGVTPRLQVADAEVQGAYASVPTAKDVELRRAVLMTDDYTLDVFDAKGTTAHTFDQSWHGSGALTLGKVAMTPTPCPSPPCVLDPADKNFGYHRLTNVAEGTAADGQWTGTWSDGLKLTALEPEATKVLHETGPGPASTGTPIPFVLARREGVTSTRYTTLLETSPTTTAVRRIANGHVQVDLADGTQDDLLYDGNGYALIKRDQHALRSVDLLQRSTVGTYVEATRTLDKASVVYAGTTLRIDVGRSARPQPVTMKIYAPGVRKVTLNNSPIEAVSAGRDYLKVTFVA